ncbi:MAG: hypothetical protein ABIY55_15700 [Kofleriaceae bacterium]
MLAVDRGHARPRSPPRPSLCTCDSVAAQWTRAGPRLVGEAEHMQRVTVVRAGVLVMFVTGIGVAWASGNWSDARSKADEFKSRQQDLRKLDPEETRRVVTAICEADEDARKDSGRDASERVAREVNDKMSELERLRNDASKLLDDVINDDNLKDNRDDAKRLKDDVATRWDMIERMSRSLRGANHPVVAFMLEQGQRAHKDRQGDCHASEVELPSGRADCLMASGGDTCTVIELKPNNSRAIGKGVDQARRYRDSLNDELKKPDSDIIKKLINTRSDFAKCKKFELQVDCYRLCPDISEDNEFREIRADWRKDCS